MKLEFINEGSRDCPLPCLSDFDDAELQRLREICASLAQDPRDRVDLVAEMSLEAVDGVKVILLRTKRSWGAQQRGTQRFEVELSGDEWAGCDEKAAGLQGTPCGHYQWLSDRGDAAWLLSRDGRW